MKSSGEEKFAAYLSQRGLAHEYEAPVGGKNPDFLVHHSVGDVSCDVYEPEIKLPASRIGMFDPFPGLRKAFENNKYEQAKAARAAGMPFVLVLVRTNSDIAFDPIIVAGAMFGNISVELTSWDERLPQRPRPFGSGAFGSEALLRGLSINPPVRSGITVRTTDGGVRVWLPKVEVRPRNRTELQPISILLPCLDGRTELQVEWRATARDMRGVAEGTFSVPIEGEAMLAKILSRPTEEDETSG